MANNHKIRLEKHFIIRTKPIAMRSAAFNCHPRSLTQPAPRQAAPPNLHSARGTTVPIARGFLHARLADAGDRAEDKRYVTGRRQQPLNFADDLSVDALSHKRPSAVRR
jgi:hypothetical protein